MYCKQILHTHKDSQYLHNFFFIFNIIRTARTALKFFLLSAAVAFTIVCLITSEHIYSICYLANKIFEIFHIFQRFLIY